MSVLSDLYNSTFTLKRATTTTATGTDTLTTITTGSCLTQPVTDRSQLFNESNWGKEYKVWLDESTAVKVGDTILIDNVTYLVAGMPEKIDLEDGTDSHLELRVYKK